MFIVARTNLKKIPSTCKECKFSIVKGSWCNSFRVCSICQKECPMERTDKGNMAYTRPNWCPLAEVEALMI